jgi:hypothetical protein
MKSALTLPGNANIQYLVLEHSVCNAVLRNLPLLEGKIEAIEHPMCPNEGTSQTVELREPIRFGFLGLADKPKGFPVFVELASRVTTKHGSRAEFHAIGHLPLNGKPVDGTEGLSTKPGVTLMSRADFVQRVSMLHYVILPHEAATYTLAASGVLLDAIAWQKPVIARKIPIFKAMFDRHGDIGYLFSDDSELRDIVEVILQTADKSRYRTQVMNLSSARKSRAPETLAKAYREMCRKSV